MQRYTIFTPEGATEEGVLVGDGPLPPETYRQIEAMAASRGGYVVWRDYHAH